VSGLPAVEIRAMVELGGEFCPPDSVIAALDDPTPPAEVEAWVATQRVLAGLAVEALAELESRWPTPLPVDIADGRAEWPAWRGTWWSEVLHFAWAANLAEAVSEARAALDG
jgi:hypothetical protein